MTSAVMEPERPSALPDEIAGALRAAGDRLGPIARRVLWYSSITSTNDAAIALADRGADEGLVVSADAQSAGRGRLGRTWTSPPGVGLYTSVILRPTSEVAGLLTLSAGVAVADGIHAATGLDADLKWPNDVCVGARKLAGILAEGGTTPGGSPYVVLGFGINVMPAAYPPAIAGRATSLESEIGRPVDRGLLLAECLAALAARYGDLRAGHAAAVLSAWRARARHTFERRVEWDADGRLERGVAEGVDDSGALLVRVGDQVRRIISGEVRWT